MKAKLHSVEKMGSSCSALQVVVGKVIASLRFVREVEGAEKEDSIPRHEVKRAALAVARKCCDLVER